MIDYTLATATELVKAYQIGATSPLTVAQQVLNHIQTKDTAVNAFCAVNPDMVLAQAMASQTRWQHQQPLSGIDGVPVAAKDSILTQNLPTCQGSLSVDPAGPWTQDAPIIAKLKQNGAVIVGKTNMSEFGHTSWHSNSATHAAVANPLLSTVSPGGSSGGSAAAVKAHMVPMALATDFGGSIVIPSTFCGVFGYKPTFGEIAMYPSDVFNMATTGLMARSIADIIYFRDVIADKACDSQPQDIASLSVGYLPQINHEQVDPINQQTVQEIVAWLKQQGAVVEEIKISVPELQPLIGSASNARLLHQYKNTPEHLQSKFSKSIQNIVSYAQQNPPDLYEFLVSKKEVLEHMSDLMRRYDILISPATVMPAPLLTTLNTANPNVLISPWSVLYAMSQQPSITIPLATQSNTPGVSMLLAGVKNQDKKLLQIAHMMSTGFAG